MKNLLKAAALRAIRYRNGINTRPVAPAAEALQRLALLDEPMPE
jgi:hypothetical protein